MTETLISPTVTELLGAPGPTVARGGSAEAASVQWPTVPTAREAREAVARRYAEDTAGIQMTIAHDQGLYRHLRFRVPGSGGLFWFDIHTAPDLLTFHGDAGTFVFSRVEDMFAFFRQPRVNLDYWAEKLKATSDPKRYSENLFRAQVIEEADRWVDDLDPAAADRLRRAVIDDVLAAAENEHEARAALDSFEYRGHTFADTWEWELTGHSTQFQWACHAIRDAVAAYDQHQADPARLLDA